ncbi:hypothetical protein [Pleionea sediminis]|uniref:hypothetical protein n=1 Tax=Pleionea sediminis TaxID=2569479 RepID=UPI00118490E4|nr:hypothetical protein [Pleionea sediminis]
MTNISTQSIFSLYISDLINDRESIPQSMRSILECATTRLIDSEIIIEDSFEPISPLKPSSVQQSLPKFEQQFVIDELVSAIKEDGFGKHFHNIIGLFGSIMLQLSANEKQQDAVTQWVDDGIFGHFLMTDMGGAALDQWKTEIVKTENGTQLKVAKKWGIEAHNLGFLMLVAKQQGKPYPVTVLVDPVRASQLTSEKIGKSFLDGDLQLGNVKGLIDISDEDLLLKGGLGAVNRFLTLCRPRFVLSLMNYLDYLKNQKRLDLKQSHQECIEYLKHVAQSIIDDTVFSVHSVDSVLALKFASNELLLDLVLQGCSPSIFDQRDLLAFTKMEGSSYRCLYEIYKKQRGRRL